MIKGTAIAAMFSLVFTPLMAFAAPPQIVEMAPIPARAIALSSGGNCRGLPMTSPMRPAAGRERPPIGKILRYCTFLAFPAVAAKTRRDKLRP